MKPKERAARYSRCRYLALALAPMLAMGCAAVPRTDLDIARQQVRDLRTELADAKDTTARLKAQNRDMATRAVEDGRRLAELEDSNTQLEKSVAAYQDERDQYATALNQIRSAVVASGDGRRTASAPSESPK